jgi:hypothetical protein
LIIFRSGQYDNKKLKTAFQEKHPGLTKKKGLFHHDNAPAVHSNAVGQQKITELRFELLAHHRVRLIWVPWTFISSQN